MPSRSPLLPPPAAGALGDDILRLDLPTPFTMGSTNCWLMLGPDDVLCIDPGFDAEMAVTAIQNALAPLGRTLGQMSTILITHTHPDHCGAAAGLAAVADAQVAVGAAEARRLTGTPEPPDRIAAVVRALGAPALLADRIGAARIVHPPVAPHRIRTVRDGDTLRAGGRPWSAHVVAGHSPGHVLLASGDGLLVSGDHLLADVQPAIHLGPDAARPWAPSVAAYLQSLDRFIGDHIVLPGHGAPFVGTASPIERARRYHQARCTLIAGRLAARGSATVWDVTVDCYPALLGNGQLDWRIASATAEIAGRLEALVATGHAQVHIDAGVSVFTARQVAPTTSAGL